MYQILEFLPSAFAPCIDDLFYLVMFFVIDEVRGWSRVGWSIGLGLCEGRKKVEMEDIVDPHGRG